MGSRKRSHSAGRPLSEEQSAQHPPKRRLEATGAVDAYAMRTPLVINGWRIYLYPTFADRYAAAAAEVRRLRDADPDGYTTKPAAKFARVLHDLVVREIPTDPASSVYRLGKSLGTDAKTWRRAKFFGRFRLFFRYSSEQRTIVYAWLNDETTLRKAGAPSDVYAVFRRMIERGTPPANWDALIVAANQSTAEELDMPSARQDAEP